MSKKRYRVLAGFSGNPMEVWHIPSLEAVRGQKVLVGIEEARWTIGGTTFNLIDALSQLSAEIDVRGLITVSSSADPAREALEQITTERGYNCRLFPCRTATSRAVVLQEENGTTTILGRKPQYDTEPTIEIREELNRYSPDLVVASGVVPDDVNLVGALFSSVGLSPIQRILNPRREFLLSNDQRCHTLLSNYTDTLVMNDVEAAALLHQEHFSQESEDDLNRLRQYMQHDLKAILVTCNRHGALYLGKDGTTIKVPAIDFGPVFETTGAGDSFLSGFLVARFEGKTLEAAMHFASVVAGVKVMKREPGMPDRNSVDAALAQL